MNVSVEIFTNLISYFSHKIVGQYHHLYLGSQKTSRVFRLQICQISWKWTSPKSQNYSKKTEPSSFICLWLEEDWIQEDKNVNAGQASVEKTNKEKMSISITCADCLVFSWLSYLVNQIEGRTIIGTLRIFDHCCVACVPIIALSKYVNTI